VGRAAGREEVSAVATALEELLSLLALSSAGREEVPAVGTAALGTALLGQVRLHCCTRHCFTHSSNGNALQQALATTSFSSALYAKAAAQEVAGVAGVGCGYPRLRAAEKVSRSESVAGVGLCLPSPRDTS